jgi:putative tryptophan/tyrosine transport system substrate-binding protein
MTLHRIAKSALVASMIGAAGIVPTFAQQKSVAVSYIVDHPVIDAMIKGIEDALKEAGYEKGKNLKWTIQSAQGNVTIAGQIAEKFAGERPDVVIGVGTPAVIALANKIKDRPIVFAGMTDPVGAKVVASLEKPGGNVTGTSDMSPVDKDMALIKEIWPGTKNVGIIYNPGEANSVTIVGLVRKHAPLNGMKVVEAVAPNSGAVLDAARSLVGKVDAIYVLADNTVNSTIAAVIKVSEENKIPTLAVDTSMVEKGILAGQGFDYYNLGKDTGQIVLRILKGESPAGIPVGFIAKTNIVVNKTAAAKMGKPIPNSVLTRADKVID